MAQLLSLGAFAKTHGVSRQAAAKWKERGVLHFSGDKVDVARSDAALRGAGLGRFKSDDPTPQPNRATDNRTRQPVAAEVDEAVDEVVLELEAAIADGEIDDEIGSGFVQELLAGHFRTKVQAAAIKENGLALKHLLAAQKLAGTLVEIDRAERVIFEDRRAARDAWMNWPARVGPLLAADLGIESATLVEALRPYVQQQLEDLGEPDLDFTDVAEG